jgi:quercetin dioxygenase-like cupin family protein
MTEAGFAEEVHDYDEAILVVEGCLLLGLGDDEVVELLAGDFFVIPAGLRHRGVARSGGSHGTLMIFDP